MPGLRLYAAIFFQTNDLDGVPVPDFSVTRSTILFHSLEMKKGKTDEGSDQSSGAQYLEFRVMFEAVGAAHRPKPAVPFRARPRP